MPKLTARRVRELLVYNRRTGVFRWRVTRGNAKAGDIAGWIDDQGYRQIRIDGSAYYAGRLTWLYIHGLWPKGIIDHKNTIRGDNWFKNLRDVTKSGNGQNQRRANRDSHTGLLGVAVHGEKFTAQIGLNGKRRYLGIFATPEKAHAAYVAAKRKLHPTCTI